MSEVIGQKFANKIIEIGEIEEITVNPKNKSNRIVFFWK